VRGIGIGSYSLGTEDEGMKGKIGFAMLIASLSLGGVSGVVGGVDNPHHDSSPCLLHGFQCIRRALSPG